MAFTPSSGKIKTILAIKTKDPLCERPLETVNSGCLWGTGDLGLTIHYIVLHFYVLLLLLQY